MKSSIEAEDCALLKAHLVRSSTESEHILYQVRAIDSNNECRPLRVPRDQIEHFIIKEIDFLVCEPISSNEWICNFYFSSENMSPVLSYHPYNH